MSFAYLLPLAMYAVHQTTTTVGNVSNATEASSSSQAESPVSSAADSSPSFSLPESSSSSLSLSSSISSPCKSEVTANFLKLAAALKRNKEPGICKTPVLECSSEQLFIIGEEQLNNVSGISTGGRSTPSTDDEIETMTSMRTLMETLQSQLHTLEQDFINRERKQANAQGENGGDTIGTAVTGGHHHINVEQQLMQLEMKHSRLEREMRMVRESIKEKMDENAILIVGLDLMKSTIQQLQMQNDEQTREILQLREQWNEQQDRFTDEKTELLSHIGALQQKIQELTVAGARLNEQLSQEVARNIVLSGEIEQKQHEIEKLEERSKEQENELAQLRNEIDRMSCMVERQEKRRLELQIEELRNEIQELEHTQSYIKMKL